MNLYKIIDEIGKTDPEVNEKLSRRDMFKSTGSFGKKIAVAALPIALATTFKSAYGKSSDIIIDVLNYALTLEYLESEFYTKGLAASSLIPDNRKAIFQKINQHEASHVAFLKSTITSLSGTPVAKPTFDFTAGGMFSDVFTNYTTFLALSQSFEDTGVRAYKGRAGDLITSDVVLTAALQIHSVEARHASMVRRLRAEKGWITGNDAASGLPAAIYAGEENLTQLNLIVTNTGPGYSSEVATEAFDEPLTADQVLAIANMFIAK